MQQTCQAGSRLHALVGPMGIPSHIGEAKKVICVGGGLGVAPVYPIARAYKEAGNKVVSIIGARSADEQRGMGVSIGDPIGYASDLTELGLNTGRYIAHGLDDRAGCVILIELLAQLKGQELEGDLCAVFSTPEEVGLRGAGDGHVLELLRHPHHRVDADPAAVAGAGAAAAAESPTAFAWPSDASVKAGP